MIHLSFETVKSYRKKIALKLGSRNITHAVAIAMQQGWINAS